MMTISPSADDGSPDPRRAEPPSKRSSGKLSLDERRLAILREAAKLFLRHGYEAVSINDIIKATGGSKATIYALFGDKEGLFDAFIRHQCCPVSLSIPLDTTGPIEGQLTTVARIFLEGVLRPDTIEFHRLMVALGRTAPERARLFFEAGPKTAYRSFADWFALRQKNGEIGGGDPYELAVLFHDMLMGEFQIALLTGMTIKLTKKDFDRKIASAVRLMMAGCGSR